MLPLFRPVKKNVNFGDKIKDDRTLWDILTLSSNVFKFLYDQNFRKKELINHQSCNHAIIKSDNTHDEGVEPVDFGEEAASMRGTACAFGSYSSLFLPCQGNSSTLV